MCAFDISLFSILVIAFSWKYVRIYLYFEKKEVILKSYS